VSDDVVSGRIEGEHSRSRLQTRCNTAAATNTTFDRDGELNIRIGDVCGGDERGSDVIGSLQTSAVAHRAARTAGRV
jgi:hypothetical protein